MLVTGHRELFHIQIHRKKPHWDSCYKVILDHYKSMLPVQENPSPCQLCWSITSVSWHCCLTGSVRTSTSWKSVQQGLKRKLTYVNLQYTFKRSLILISQKNSTIQLHAIFWNLWLPTGSIRLYILKILQKTLPICPLKKDVLRWTSRKLISY